MMKGKECVKSRKLVERTQAFALSVVGFVDALPNGKVSDVLVKQLLRCATSVGANYRGACRARSQADFIAKMKIVEEETDESIYFLELLQEIDDNHTKILESLLAEANELLSIFVASIKTARSNK